MVSADYLAQRERRDALLERLKVEQCAAGGHPLTVAFFDGVWRLRCGACGQYDVETRMVRQAGLLARWRRGEGLNAIERMQLERQLYKMINRAETNGETPDPRWAQWLQQLEGA